MLTRRTPILARLRRRQAIRLGLGGVAAVVLAELGGLFPVFLRPLRESGFGGRIEAGPLEEIVAHFRAHDDDPFLVTRGRFYLLHPPEGLLAVFRRCTHLGCTYAFAASEDQFHCPCHSSVFDKRTGVVRGGPTTRPLDLFPMEIVDGVVVVDTDPREGHFIRRSGYEPSQATPIAR